jgi:mRNA-degrading endonuclease RelE of RelBE toxin-antitoxin system
MVIHFRQKKRFSEDFEGLSKEGKERVLKELKKWKEMGLDHIKHRSEHLKGQYGGIRKLSFGRFRIYFIICDECRMFGHDKTYGRCEKCPKEKDLINLVDVIELRKDDTYDNIDFFKNDVKEFVEGTYEA